MIEDFLILKLEDICDIELIKSKVPILRGKQKEARISKVELLGSGLQYEEFEEFCIENKYEDLLAEVRQLDDINVGTWKKISSVYGKNIQNNCLKRNPSNTHNWRDEVNNINDLVLNYLGWSKKEDKNISHGHIIVYPKGGDMKKHGDGDTRNRIFTIIGFPNEDRKLEDGGLFDIWDKSNKKHSVIPNIENIVVLNHRTDAELLHMVTENLVEELRYSMYNIITEDLLKYYEKNQNMKVVNFVFEKIGEPNGKPNTTMNGIFFNSTENSLYYKRKFYDVNNIPHENYVYLVEPFGGITNIIYGDNFINYIDSRVLDDIRSHKCDLIISSPSEGNLKERDIKQLYKILYDNNIPINKVTFVQSNYNLETQIENFINKSKYGKKINSIITEHKLETSKESFIQIKSGEWDTSKMKKPPTLNTIEQVKEIENDFRPFRFLSHNKSLRPDRVALLSLLYKEGIFDKGLISMGSEQGGSAGTSQPWPKTFDFITDKNLLSDVMEWSTKLEPLRPISIEGDLNIDDIDSGENEGANPCGYTYSDQYRKVYFQVVTEDVFEAESMFFSQTTYKPLVQLTPIVMFGSPNMMRCLHEVQNFLPYEFINYDYDLVVDNNERLLMVVDEIKRLCKMPIEQLHKNYYDELETILKNQNKIYHEVHSMDEYKLSRYLLSRC